VGFQGSANAAAFVGVWCLVFGVLFFIFGETDFCGLHRQRRKSLGHRSRIGNVTVTSILKNRQLTGVVGQ
jgi:hypothetical protein